MQKPQTFRQKYFKQKPRKDHRESAHRRGYDAKWRRFRKWFLAHPCHCVCNDCGKVTATEVHHVKALRDYPGLRLVESNCVGLCKSCHSIRTGKER